MANLTLPLKRKWFEQIKAGFKTEEYRLDNSHWRKRIEGKEFEKVIVTLGYPSRDNLARRIEFPWNGYEIKTITSEEWGNKPQRVFAIKLIPESQGEELEGADFIYTSDDGLNAVRAIMIWLPICLILLGLGIFATWGGS